MKTGFTTSKIAGPAHKMWQGRKHHLMEDLRFLHRLLRDGPISCWPALSPRSLEEYRIGAETFMMELEQVGNETELEILEPRLGTFKKGLYEALLYGSLLVEGG